MIHTPDCQITSLTGSRLHLVVKLGWRQAEAVLDTEDTQLLSKKLNEMLSNPVAPVQEPLSEPNPEEKSTLGKRLHEKAQTQLQTKNQQRVNALWNELEHHAVQVAEVGRFESRFEVASTTQLQQKQLIEKASREDITVVFREADTSLWLSYTF